MSDPEIKPDKPRNGDLGFTFDAVRKHWNIFRAEVGHIPVKHDYVGMLWVPPKEQEYHTIVKWVRINVLTAEGKVLEVEQQCSGGIAT